MTGWVLLLVLELAQASQQPPVPRPFPQPGSSQPGSTQPAQSRPPQQTPPATPAAPASNAPPVAPAMSLPVPASPMAPTEATLGVPIYPGAQYLTSFDAGRGQRFYLYGSTASFVDLVKYYRTILKRGNGELVFETPPTHEFEIGRFREEEMAFPPSVTIKEYKSEISEGYPNPVIGGQPARFPTVIQIVPAPATDR